MNYTTSSRSAVSPDGGRTAYPLGHAAVRAFLESGGEIGEPLIVLENDLPYIQDVHDADLINTALDLLRLKVGTAPSDPPAPVEAGEAATTPINEEEEDIVREIDIRGVTYKVSTKDALTLLGAFIVNLARDPARIDFVSGESVEVTIDDIEHIGRQLAGKEP
jgi:hypothetical protein